MKVLSCGETPVRIPVALEPIEVEVPVRAVPVETGHVQVTVRVTPLIAQSTILTTAS